MPQAERQQKWK